MKILLTCDPEIPVPPIHYGGIERIADALISSYSENGHEVFLVAHPESTSISAKSIFGWPKLNSRGLLNTVKNAFFLLKIIRKVKPDIIHSFSRLMYLYPAVLFSRISFVQSYQRRISNTSTYLFSLWAGKRIHFTSCAAYMLNGLRIAQKGTGIYNFTDTGFFIPVVDPKTEFLFFLGRIEEIKGTYEAIQVALATNTKLIIAGNIQPGHDHYFNTYVKPYFNNPLIEYVGPVNDAQKRAYLQKAKAFLFPIKWEEPFGIVMAEAMACGVPVIGFRRGSVPEVVQHGITGFIVDTVEGMAEAVNHIDKIDRNKVREVCEKRFSQDVIAKQYLNLLNTLSNQNH